MATDYLQALIVSADDHWKGSVAATVRRAGGRAHEFERGLPALRKLTKKHFDLVIVDDSVADVSPLEFCFHLRDMADQQPITIVVGSELSNYADVWRRCRVHCVGDKDAITEMLPDAVEAAHERRVKNGMPAAVRKGGGGNHLHA